MTGYFITLVSLIFILSSCGLHEDKDRKGSATYKVQDCLNAYPNFLITAKELMTDSFYNSRRFKNFEKTEIDSSLSSTLYLKYRFKVKDTVSNFYMTIGTMISFEKSEEAAQKTLDNWDLGHRIGFDSSPAKNLNIVINNLDSILSFGEISKFVEYRNEGYLRGYTLIGRTKNIAYLHSISSNHIEHHNHINNMREKINKLTEFANKHEKENGL